MRTLALLLAIAVLSAFVWVLVGLAFEQEPATYSASSTTLSLPKGVIVYDKIDWAPLDETLGHDAVLDALRDAGKRGWICEALGFHVWEDRLNTYTYTNYCPEGCDEYRHCRICGIRQRKRAPQWEDVKP